MGSLKKENSKPDRSPFILNIPMIARNWNPMQVFYTLAHVLTHARTNV
jgi:hypothetical protein